MRLPALFKGVFLGGVLLTGSQLLADGAPSPYDQNTSGGYFEADMVFGQSRAVGESNPGSGWFLGIGGGYISARQSWNRLEAGLELGIGSVSFRDKDLERNIEVPIDFYILAKFGYGYAVSDNVFGVIRLGAGPASATYPAKGIVDETTADGIAESDETVTGFMGLVGYEIVVPSSSGAEFFGGLQIRFANFAGDKADSFQLNIPALTLGARLTLGGESNSYKGGPQTY